MDAFLFAATVSIDEALALSIVQQYSWILPFLAQIKWRSGDIEITILNDFVAYNGRRMS
jgi:hypothetical protein